MATDKEKDRFGALVREMRGKVSQRKFALALDISYTSIQEWEKGAEGYAFPNDGNLLKIAERLGWSLHQMKTYLATGKKPKNTQLDLILDAIVTLPPDQVIFAQRALTNRIEELLTADVVH